MKMMRLLLAGILIAIVAGIGFFIQQSTQQNGQVQIELYSDPYPMAIGPVDLMVSLTDARGNPIEGADVHATTQYLYHAPLTEPARQYENDQYHIPIVLVMMGQITVTISATLPDGETVVEEFVTFVYAGSSFRLETIESQRYRSEREIAAELASAPENEYWIIVPQGAQEISGMYFTEFVPSLIELSVSGKNTLVIRNDDFVDNSVGPFYVAAGETLRQRFDEPGLFIGTCTVNQGLVRVEVSE